MCCYKAHCCVRVCVLAPTTLSLPPSVPPSLLSIPHPPQPPSNVFHLAYSHYSLESRSLEGEHVSENAISTAALYAYVDPTQIIAISLLVLEMQITIMLALKLALVQCVW